MTDDTMPFLDALAEARRGRFHEGSGRGGAGAADGLRRGRADRRGPLRAQRGAHDAAQRLSPPRLRHAAGDARSEDPEAAQGLVLSRLPRAAPHDRAGLGGGDPGGLDPGRLDPQGGRPRAGDGDERDLEEPGVGAVQGHRCPGELLPGAADRGGLDLPVARRDLPEGARERAHRVGGGHNRHGREHRWPARDPRARARPVGGRRLLARVPARPGEARAEGRQARHLGRARRFEGRHRPGLQGNVAKVSRSLHAECFGLRAEGPASDGGCRHQDGVHAGRPCRCVEDLATGRRSTAPAHPESWRP